MLATLLATLLSLPGLQAGDQAPDTRPAAEPDDGWTALRKRVAERLAADGKRLAKALEPYLADLALEYSDKNKDYLDKRYDEISALDPDVALVLVEKLVPVRHDRSQRRIADACVRILERLDPAPLQKELRGLLGHQDPEVRGRALFLLTGFVHAGLDDTLQRMLREMPPGELPVVLRSIGRYGRPELGSFLVPFLERPEAAQRDAAFEALCRIATVKDLAALHQAAAKGGAPELERLAVLLARLQAVPGERGFAGDPARFFAVLGDLVAKGQALSRDSLVDTLALLRRLPAQAGKDHGGKELLEALDRLLENPYPEVQFEAALAMEHLGQDDGTRKVLDRLNQFVRKNRRVAYAYVQRGRAHEAFGHWNDALRDYKEAIALSSRGRVDPNLYFAAARIEAFKGNATGCARWLEKAEPTPKELAGFRREVPELEGLFDKSTALRKLYGLE